jgi:AraC family transcriptional regulator of arabinose operon
VPKTYKILLAMFDADGDLGVPFYDGLLAGHHFKESGHTSRRHAGTDDWLLIATRTGLGRIGTSEGDFDAGPGTVAMITPGTPHDYGTARKADGWEILWVHFHPPAELQELLVWPTVAPGISLFRPIHWTEVEEAFRDILRRSLSTARRRRQMAMNALERLLLICEAELPQGGHRIDDRIRTVLEYIHGHLGQPLNLENLSERVHLSPSRFSHLFREEVGLAPLQYIVRQRIRRAQTLLKRTTMSVGEVAAEVGMEPFHFSARFKAETGLGPRAYRAAE